MTGQNQETREKFIQLITAEEEVTPERIKEAWMLYAQGDRFSNLEMQPQIQGIQRRMIEVVMVDRGFADPTTFNNFSFNVHMDLKNEGSQLVERLSIGDQAEKARPMLVAMMNDLKTRKEELLR